MALPESLVSEIFLPRKGKNTDLIGKVKQIKSVPRRIILLQQAAA
jgi:hypothetical protein